MPPVEKDRFRMNLQQLFERTDRPFLSHPQVGRYFPAASIEDARRRLARTIERGEGPGVVIGGAGTGKSMLLQILAAQYHERFDVVLLACAQMHTRRGLLQAIHFELGLDHYQRDEGELRLSLLDHLLSTDQSAQGLLLLVDEAQSLPIQLIEEIRVIGNLARNGAPRVRVVLAGLPSLEERLASPELDSFNQRLTARCCLAPFARAETAQYAQAQIAVCGADPQQFFSPEAWGALFEATDGVPRLINQLSDRAMSLAVDDKLSYIDGATMRRAWADLQQLPTSPESLSESASTAVVSDSIEFGSLDDDDSPRHASVLENKISAPQLLPQTATARQSPALKGREANVSTDERPEFIAAGTQRRPRTFDDCVPEAIDPFADEFEEEELVLDRFSLLSEMFHSQTPRVSNRRDPAFARLVGRALNNGFDASDNLGGETQRVAAPAESRQSFDHGDPTQSGLGPAQPTIRLAIVDDSAHPDREPSLQRLVVDVGAHKLLNLSVPTDGNLRPAPVKLSPAVSSNFHLSMPPAAPSRETLDPILVIEDDPVRVARPQPGVRREEYRDLFSRLRHGT
jgi:type II secretory pathway predicted ATPase ExeA